jgi:hypothetical protein
MPRTHSSAGAAPELGDFSRSVVKVLTPDGNVAGAGFLVADRVLVTCAHVLGASPPEGTVTVAFPRFGAVRFVGHLVPGAWRGADADDVAFVQLTRVPAGVTPLPLGSASGRRGRAVQAYGFPEQAPQDGHYGHATAGALLPGAYGGLLQLSNANDLTVLFSGSPVVDEDAGLVIGMVTEITGLDRYARGVGIAYATPAEILQTIYPAITINDDECPYQGLEAFTSDRAQWFHGRVDAITTVLDGLRRDSRFLLLLGPSGSGKSSLIQAGVLPALADGALPRQRPMGAAAHPSGQRFGCTS